MKDNVTNGELDKKVKTYSKRVAKDVEKAFKKIGEYPSKRDYPAMASACCCMDNIEVDRSKSPQSASFHPTLRNKLVLLGKIGQKRSSAICGNIIGKCAEVHAANKLLKRNKCKKLENIRFSVAMRPRTLEKFPPCENCKATFPTLK